MIDRKSKFNSENLSRLQFPAGEKKTSRLFKQPANGKQQTTELANEPTNFKKNPDENGGKKTTNKV